jgi:uncharacterized protein
MKIELDPAKPEKNSEELDLPFNRAIDFDWAAAKFAEDVRNTYPEPRFVAIGYLDKRLHVICFTPVPGRARIISFRKANDRKAKRYGKAITID